jgi:superfamily II DNA helicase RecQ
MLNQHTKFHDLIQSPQYANSIGGLIVDEAHVISQWGTSFQKEYGNIMNARALVPLGVLVYATTATAQPTVLAEICEKLGINQDTSFYLNMGNDRPNLTQEVQFMSSAEDFSALDFLAQNVKMGNADLPCSIVFVNSIAHSQLACCEFCGQLPNELWQFVGYLNSK